MNAAARVPILMAVLVATGLVSACATRSGGRPGDVLVVLMPDTGHFAMFEQPEEFNQIVLDYLG